MKIVTAVLVATSLCSASAQVEHFDRCVSGSSPSGWSTMQTGKGQSQWRVESDVMAPSKPNVLKQSGVATFPVALKDEPILKNGFVQAKFKTVSGKEDQAAGVVWRAVDADNYYVARANALENNVVLYKVLAGKRQPLDILGRTGGYGVETKVSSNMWHLLRVEFRAQRFVVFFDGNELFAVEDETFRDPGKVGVWTKADSVTLFDDFSCGAN